MSDAIPISFFATPPHECSYLEGRQAVTVFADPRAAMDMTLYSVLIQHGYRRSGSHVYIPHCPDCDSCRSLRVPVDRFTPNRAQRRSRRDNWDLEVSLVRAEVTREHYELYRRYIQHRHRGGGMEDMDEAQCQEFLLSEWSDTRFVEFRHEGRLIGVSVIDVVSDGFSAVYTFFDPEYERRGLGTFAILWLIEEAVQRGLPFVYLGYWIRESAKMAYKAKFRPHQIFFHGAWLDIEPGSH